LKKLRHYHIIELIGTYTQGPYLGLLLYPVAITDLWTFMEDLDSLLNKRLSQTDEQKKAPEQFSLLGFDSDVNAESYPKDLVGTAQRFLLRRIGCLIRAVAYLHQNSIRHKDLKVVNTIPEVCPFSMPQSLHHATFVERT
jgi:serine/threonine protein kinase